MDDAPRTQAEIAADQAAAAAKAREAQTQEELNAGNDKPATPDNPRVTVQGDAEAGWHVEVHDGTVTTTHSPDVETESQAVLKALKAHDEAVDQATLAVAGNAFPGLDRAVKAAIADALETAILPAVSDLLGDEIKKLDFGPAVQAAVTALMPTIESHIQQVASASLQAMDARVRALETASKQSAG